MGATEDMMSDVETYLEDPDTFLITSKPWRFPEFEDLIALADQRKPYPEHLILQ